MQHLKKHLFLIAIFTLFILVGGYLVFKVYSLITPDAKPAYATAGNQIAANYYDYSTENLEKADREGDAVLFFSTNWCSTCTELDKELINESEKLNDGITVLRIDYDRAADLKKKYSVVVQHTLIHVDGDGNEVKKWVGGDIADINKNIKN